jgi:GNAT superfamily N-acetyltransferase
MDTELFYLCTVAGTAGAPYLPQLADVGLLLLFLLLFLPYTLETLKPAHSITVRRATAHEADAAFSLIEEYYDAIGVLVRDDRSTLEHYLTSPESSIWVAYVGDRSDSVPYSASATEGPSVDSTPAGCVMLRPLPQVPLASEVKRLYVRPAHRGLGLAHALMQAAEDHARREGLQWLYLDTKDDLHDAIHFYLSTGYTHCPRYNDNPQATIFLRKKL